MSDGERFPYRWKVLVSVIFGLFMVVLDTTVVNVAFQTLRREFNASLADSQWIISIYVLSLGIATPLAGFLADRVGIKRVYVGGLATFVAGSLLCGVAPSLRLLVVARALQGVGGGLAIPLGTALLLRAFRPQEQGFALGVFGVVLLVAPALGPILGGVLVDAGRWRWIFFINLPIGLLGVVLASRFLREQRSERRGPLDLPGLATEVVGFGSVLYAASLAEQRGWTAPEVLLWFGIGAAGLAAFVLVELFVAKEPLLDLRLYGKRTFLLATLVGYVSVLALFGAEFLLPLYLQSMRGKTALQTGFILLPLAVSAAVAAPLAGRLYDRVGPRPLLVAGFSLLAVNTWQLSRLDADTPVRWILFLLVLRGLALGMTVQTTMVTALSVVTGPQLPRGSSLVNATRQVVQSIGVAVLATILASTLSPEVKAFQLRAQEAPARAGHSFAICGGGTPAAPPGGSAGVEVPPPLAMRACRESVAGFERAYRYTFYLSFVAILLGALLPGWPREWAGRRSAAHPESGIAGDSGGA